MKVTMEFSIPEHCESNCEQGVQIDVYDIPTPEIGGIVTRLLSDFQILFWEHVRVDAPPDA